MGTSTATGSEILDTGDSVADQDQGPVPQGTRPHAVREGASAEGPGALDLPDFRPAGPPEAAVWGRANTARIPDLRPGNATRTVARTRAPLRHGRRKPAIRARRNTSASRAPSESVDRGPGIDEDGMTGRGGSPSARADDPGQHREALGGADPASSQVVDAEPAPDIAHRDHGERSEQGMNSGMRSMGLMIQSSRPTSTRRTSGGVLRSPMTERMSRRTSGTMATSSPSASPADGAARTRRGVRPRGGRDPPRDRR